MQQGVRVLLRLILFALAFTVIMALLSVVAKAQDDNLLRDGGFEGTYTNRGRADLKLPDDWDIWIGDSPHTEDWMNLPPNAAPIGAVGDPTPHSGARSLAIDRGYATFSAAVYQRVSVDDGTNLTASAFAFERTCKIPDGENTCTSTADSNAFVRVGIDPNGGTNPFDADVIWSDNATPHDQWQQVSISATASGSTVTVFLYASQQWAYEVNTVYWDDASLTVGGTGSVTVQPTQDQRVVHVVQAGETLDSIAFSYGKTREELLALNHIDDPRIIQIGQEIVISAPATPTPTATPEQAESTGESIPTTPTLIPEVRNAAPAPVTLVASGDLNPAQTVTSICVTFYEDANQNRIQDTEEDVLAGGQLLLTLDGAPVGSHETGSAADPYCFTDLQPGSYDVQGVAPTGYGLTTPDQLHVQGYAGSQINVAFGAAEGVEAVTAVPSDSDGVANPSAENDANTNADNRLPRNIGLIVFAVAVIVLVGGFSASMLMRRR